MNAILLINIVRVLLMKLRGSPEHFKTGLRAAILLLPIFGVQYMFRIVPFEPTESCGVDLWIAKYFSVILESLQGAIVAVIFCLLNSDVSIDGRFFAFSVAHLNRHSDTYSGAKKLEQSSAVVSGHRELTSYHHN